MPTNCVNTSISQYKISLAPRASARFSLWLKIIALGAAGTAVCGCNNSAQTAAVTGTTSASAAAVVPAETLFERVTDFRVNGQVAEIITASPDGKTLVYTNATDGQIGFVDITDPAKPRDVMQLKAGGEPTSAAITPDGKWLICCVHGKPDRLLIYDFVTRKLARQIALPGQPDCVAISADGRYAAIVIENERTDLEKPMPQAPPGSLAVLELKGTPAGWKLRGVGLRGLPLFFPDDPEPEYISINTKNQAAVTLQENNGVAIIDLPAAKLVRSWSCGATTHAADLKDNKQIDFIDELKGSPREPDAIGWTRGGNLITANEGDYDTELEKGEYSGGRNATLFSADGKVLHDFNDLEPAMAAAGLYKDKRSDKRGVEPEGVAVARYSSQGKDRDVVFIGCERADGVAVYDIASESQPRFLQVLPTGERPEGLLPLPQRGLFVSANEGDGTVSIYKVK